MKKILVTGGAGQLASAIKAIAKEYKNLNFVFKTAQELNLTEKSAIHNALEEGQYDLVVNTAAYTAVDKAETDASTAYAINALAVKHLAEETSSKKLPLIHISTDYVFDGTVAKPRLETDTTNPIGVYGKTKLDGEHFALQCNPQTIIIRTAWVYSEFGSNFLKTMLRLFAEKEQIGVIDDQIGSPTNANDLARAIAAIASSEELTYGIFNYSNEGKCSWFEFASTIKELVDSPIKINPISSSEYATAAKRPAFSLLDKTKIKEAYRIVVPHWKDSLEHVLRNMEQLK